LQDQRALFRLPGDLHYLNCAFMGPLPREAQRAGEAAMARKAVPTEIGPDDFFRDSQTARELFATMVGADDASRVAIMPAVSYGVAVAARNLPCQPGQRIVVAEGQFPSNVYSWRRLAAERQAALLAVAPPADGDHGRAPGWNRALLEAIDERTAIVALPQVHWTDGTRFDLEAIGARARQYGAALVVDGTQSIGAMPFHLERIRPAAVVCAAYKWLLGPYGLAFAWLGPQFDDGVPLEETWIGRRDSHQFQRLVEYRDEYQPGAARYDVGERSNFILLPMAIAAMRLVHGWGADAVQQHCAALFQPVIDEAMELGFSAEPASGRGAHLFGLRAPSRVELGALNEELRRRNVHASLRGNALRVSPFGYNDQGDALALLTALRDSVS
jgi:selenocysteine lyase/cysteine desulfurase